MKLNVNLALMELLVIDLVQPNWDFVTLNALDLVVPFIGTW